MAADFIPCSLEVGNSKKTQSKAEQDLRQKWGLKNARFSALPKRMIRRARAVYKLSVPTAQDEKVRIGPVPLSFLTVAGGIAEAHHICLATRFRAARSKRRWNKTSLVVPPPASAVVKKQGLQVFAGAYGSGCIDWMWGSVETKLIITSSE